MGGDPSSIVKLTHQIAEREAPNRERNPPGNTSNPIPRAHTRHHRYNGLDDAFSTTPPARGGPTPLQEMRDFQAELEAEYEKQTQRYYIEEAHIE